MVTVLLYLALAEKQLFDRIRIEKRQDWDLLWSKGCNDLLTADACSNFFPRKCCDRHKCYDKREPGFFREEFR